MKDLTTVFPRFTLKADNDDASFNTISVGKDGCDNYWVIMVDKDKTIKVCAIVPTNDVMDLVAGDKDFVDVLSHAYLIQSKDIATGVVTSPTPNILYSMYTLPNKMHYDKVLDKNLPMF